MTYRSAHPDAWDSLPREFVEKITTSICKNLDYLDVCRLAGVSRVFSETATAYKDEMPTAIKHQGIREAEMYFTQHHKQPIRRSQLAPRNTAGSSSPGSSPQSLPAELPDEPSTPGSTTNNTSIKNFACYECCRVIPATSFAQGQPETVIRHADGRMSHDDGRPYLDPGTQRVSPHRFCITCGVDRGFYRPGDQIMVAGTELWFCRCLIMHVKNMSPQSSHRCERCGEQCFHPAPRDEKERRPKAPKRTPRSLARSAPY